MKNNSSLIENIRKEQDAIFEKEFGVHLFCSSHKFFKEDILKYLSSRDKVIISTLTHAIEVEVEKLRKEIPIGIENDEVASVAFGSYNQALDTILATLKKVNKQ